jgi:hypothetical protein
VIDPLRDLETGDARRLAALLAAHPSLSAATAASKLYRATLDRAVPAVALDRAELTAVVLTLDEHPGVVESSRPLGELQAALRTALGHPASGRNRSSAGAAR